jgi:glycosyltransferase involved in cell wall biosynthesis
MRIGFLTPEYVTEAYFSGGLAQSIHRTAVALQDRGHEPHVFTLSDRDEDVEKDGIPVHRIAGGRLARFLTRASAGHLCESAEWIDFSVRAWRRLARLHRRSRFDVLQVPNYSACGLVSSVLLPIPFTVRLSTYGPEWNDRAGIPRTADRAASEWLERLQIRFARHVYAPSRRVQELAREGGGRSDVERIPTPFFLEKCELDESLYENRFAGKSYLLFVGRYQLHKGFHVLADALDEVFEAIPDLHAAFVGMDLPSSLDSSMRHYAEKASPRHRDRLIFVGQTPHEQLYPVITGSRLVVLPSLVDNLPNACLEAMALGKPVIGTSGASFEELLTDGISGFLVPPGDPRALADRIIAVWDRPDLDSIGEAARRRAGELAPDRTIPLLEEHFRLVVRAP